MREGALEGVLQGVLKGALESVGGRAFCRNCVKGGEREGDGERGESERGRERVGNLL